KSSTRSGPPRISHRPPATRSIAGIAIFIPKRLQRPVRSNEPKREVDMWNRFGRFMSTSAAAVVLLLFPGVVFGQQCNQATPEPVVNVTVPGHPFFAMESPDGCWIFVSMQPGRPPAPSGVAVIRRSGGKFTLERTVPLGSSVGMVITHDGKMLIVAND